MSEHVNFKCASLRSLKLIIDKMSSELKAKTHTIGVKLIREWINDVNKAIADGIAGQIDLNFGEAESSSQQQVSQPSSEEISNYQKIDEPATGPNQESIEARLTMLETRTERIEKLVDSLVNPKTNHVSYRSQNQNIGFFPNKVKTCFVCGRKGHLSYNCWFNPNFNDNRHQNHFRQRSRVHNPSERHFTGNVRSSPHIVTPNPRYFTKTYQNSTSYHNLNPLPKSGQQFDHNFNWNYRKFEPARNIRPQELYTQDFRRNDFLGESSRIKYNPQNQFNRWHPETRDSTANQMNPNVGTSYGTM